MYGVLDIGTTGVKLFIYDKEGNLKYYHRSPLGFMKIESNYMEQDSGKLWDITLLYIKKLKNEHVKYIGLSTYRASTVIWDKEGNPVTNVITWIDRRGWDVINNLPFHLKISSKLPLLKTIFSPDSPAILYKWLLLKHPDLKEKIDRNELYFGTLDSYLAYRLTGEYLTDVTNATLTGLIHPKTFKPISIVNKILDLPQYTPRIVDNIEVLGEVDNMMFNVLIADQQAAILAEGCLSQGCVKVTNGTGSFVDMILDKFRMPKKGLIPIVVTKIGDYIIYGVEGFLPSSGIILDWMVSKKFIKDYETICEDKEKGEDLYFLPLFRGLRTPFYPGSSGLILGLTLENKSLDIARGFIKGVAFLIQKILQEMIWQFGYRPDVIYCNGGFSRCDKLIQTIADYTGFYVARSHDVEATGRGVFKLLEIASGRLSIKDIKESEQSIDLFTPLISEKERDEKVRRWSKALKVGLNWSL